MNTTLSPEMVRAVHERLHEAGTKPSAHHRGESGGRQPVHTFSGGAHLFRADTIVKLGALAVRALEPAAERLRNFIAKAAQATLVGGVFDDAATGQGLLNYFVRAINCGAIAEKEAGTLTGLTVEELGSRSFVKILNKRREAR